MVVPVSYTHLYVYTEGIPLYGLKYPEIKVWGQGYIGMIPVPIILTVIIFAVSAYLFYKTKFGRYTVSIGSNEEAAKPVSYTHLDVYKRQPLRMTPCLAARYSTL